jgi:error-prone DNA polymerase
MSGLALTDYMSVSGVVEFQRACREHGIRSIVGAGIAVAGDQMVLLAQDRRGYANLCEIITRLYQDEDLRKGEAGLDLLERYRDRLIALVGGRFSRVRSNIRDEDRKEAERWLRRLDDIFPGSCYVELSSHLEEGERTPVSRTARIARDLDIPTVATNTVLYATPDEYAMYDLYTCIRLIRSVYEPHPERPRNAQGYLKPIESLFPDVIDDRQAIERTIEVAERCEVDLLPDRVIPPEAAVPAGQAPGDYLLALCEEGLRRRIPSEREQRAREQLHRELETIRALDLEEFFLVVHEVVAESSRRGIRYAGRGSAANSIVCYLLYITHVDPIEQNLLFERFLHTGRKGTPDIDVDFDSDRRDEIIEWMEQRFGIRHTAMTGTFVRFRLRSALRETVKALGWPIDTVNLVGKAVPHTYARSIDSYRDRVEEVIGKSPLLDTAVDCVKRMEECPRYLGQHNGGMMLSRDPLAHYTPVQTSANGVRIGQHDKNAVEGLGIIKFDILGLRMLACVSEAIELVRRHEGIEIDTDDLDLEDPEVYEFIRTGRTLGLFQIESGGQMHLIAKSQPENFHDLITQVAIFRPGPVQSGMVHPYVRRRRGLEPVRYLHPDLEPILKDTLGVILFQEQILEIAHRFAGMTLRQADEFRRLMSRFRSHEGMASMEESFVDGAVGRGVPRPIAEKVFEQVSYFVGYGFCRSHAAAFAQTVFVSAYLKLHHPAAYMAALMQHRPGMFPQMTLEQEAKRFGVRTLLPDVERSSTRFSLEREADGILAIRKPLTSIREVSQKEASAIALERLFGEYRSVEDLYRRVPVSRDALESLARAGALDAIADNSRRALWEIGVLANRLGPAGCGREERLIDLPAIAEEDIPSMPLMELDERVRWDLSTHASARVHPMSLVRRQLNDWEVRTIGSLKGINEETVRTKKPFIVTTAGLVIMRQRPATAKGTCFIILEDETDFMQTVVFPTVLDQYRAAWSMGSLIVRGELQMHGNWRGLVVQQVWPLDRVAGGYTGYPGADGGRDRMVLPETRTIETTTRGGN